MSSCSACFQVSRLWRHASQSQLAFAMARCARHVARACRFDAALAKDLGFQLESDNKEKKEEKTRTKEKKEKKTTAKAKKPSLKALLTTIWKRANKENKTIAEARAPPTDAAKGRA